MAILPICLFPATVLRQRSRPADWRDSRIQGLLKDLIDTLYAQPGGIGIAAPQVGAPWRIAIVDVSSRDPSKNRLIMINPRLTVKKGKILSREGCMSVPDYTANLARYERIVVEWTDPAGRQRALQTKGIEAICVQHEIDHLNGTLFLDRVSFLKTDVFPRKRK